jgi:hypothetical protein
VCNLWPCIMLHLLIITCYSISIIISQVIVPNVHILLWANTCCQIVMQVMFSATIFLCLNIVYICFLMVKLAVREYCSVDLCCCIMSRFRSYPEIRIPFICLFTVFLSGISLIPILTSSIAGSTITICVWVLLNKLVETCHKLVHFWLLHRLWLRQREDIIDHVLHWHSVTG